MTSAINITETLFQTRKMLAESKEVPPDFAALVSVLLTALEGFLHQQKPTSQNSSLPPSQDPNRLKQLQSGKSDKKPGGQAGHVGKTLRPIENPDEIINVPVVILTKRWAFLNGKWSHFISPDTSKNIILKF